MMKAADPLTRTAGPGTQSYELEALAFQLLLEVRDEVSVVDGVDVLGEQVEHRSAVRRAATSAPK